MFTKTIYLNYLFKYLQRSGITEKQLFSKSGLQLTDLNNPTDTKKLNLNNIQNLIEHAINTHSKEGLGLTFGDLLDIPLHGTIGNLIMTSDNLLEALKNGVSFSSIVSSLVGLTLDSQLNHTALIAETALNKKCEIFLIESLFTSIKRMICTVLPHHHLKLKLMVRYPEPSYKHLYLNYFDNVLFSQARNELIIASNYLSLPLNSANEFSNQFALAECQKLLVDDNQSNLVLLIPKLIASRPHFYNNLTSVAKVLGMSIRTLNRKLAIHNTSFRDILNNTRLSLAKYYLSHTELSVAEISDRLGYSDPSNFSNYFRKVIRQSPSCFREQFKKFTT